MPSASFEAKLAAARVWEQLIAEWTRSHGYSILPTYDFSGKGDDKAPKLLAPSGEQSLVMPDLQCFKAGRGAWIECKYKSSASRYNRGGYDTTGIPLRLYSHYIEVERVTQMPVTVAFIHESEDEVRAARLADLSETGALYSHKDLSGKMSRGGMIFWRYAALPILIPRLSALTSREAA